MSQLKYYDPITSTWKYVSQGVAGDTGIQGDAGDTGADSTVSGDTGIQGDTGITGDTGADSTVAGDTGVQGDTGAGTAGDTGIQGDTGADSTVAGDTGIQGDTGADSTVAGDTGIQGDTGITGDTGADSTVAGDTGITGDTGIQGDTGTQGGNLLADLVFNNFNLQLTIEPSTDEKASGLFWKDATVDTNAQGIGAPLFMAADGHFDTATGSMTTAPCVALALESGSGTKDVLMLGIMRQDSWNWTTGPGRLSLIYISGSLGTLTQTIPTLTDQMIQPVGWAITDDCMWFNPSLMFATHT